MEISKLNADLSVSSQIFPDDLPALHRAGIRSIICNRPDGEEPGKQPAFDRIEQEARRLGIEVRYLPTVPNNVTDQQGMEFGRLMDELPKPVLGYCRSGKRSTTMWALSQAGKQPTAAILEAAAKAGYDLTDITARLDKVA